MTDYKTVVREFVNTVESQRIHASNLVEDESYSLEDRLISDHRHSAFEDVMATTGFQALEALVEEDSREVLSSTRTGKASREEVREAVKAVKKKQTLEELLTPVEVAQALSLSFPEEQADAIAEHIYQPLKEIISKYLEEREKQDD